MNVLKLNGKRKDITGRKYGRLIAWWPVDKTPNNMIIWECLCSCGKLHKVRISDLTTGRTQSCGCIIKDRYSFNDYKELNDNTCVVYMSHIRKEEMIEVLVDKESIPIISKYHWYLSPKGYAIAQNKGKIFYMHRLILGDKLSDDLQTDHINGNRLDNRLQNLRAATALDNKRNITVCRSQSGYKGAYPISRKSGMRWYAQIKYFNKRIYLGTFKTKEDAAKAYNDAATKYYGEFACLNVIKE